ncbi:MAG: hypothetical protein ABIZ34_01650 [Candidatus Limnocylindrales bacterium]
MARPSGGGRADYSGRPPSGRLSVGRDSSPFRRNAGEPRLPMLAVAVIGLVALVLGLFFFRPDGVSFELGGALRGVLGQLPTTLPAALSVAIASAMEIAGGAVLVRLIRWSPYGSIAEAVVAGVIGAVAKDTILLLTLGAVGHFQPLVLAVMDLALIVGALFLRPFVRRGDGGPGRMTAASTWSGVGWIAIAVVWAIPVIVQLSSPVAPFADGIANHVAPIEYLQTTHSYPTLSVAPSPNYGSAGTSLGYVAFVGSVASLTSLPASLAVAAFALPLAMLLAAGGLLVAGSLAGRAAGVWTMMTVPLTFAFLRLPDASAVVLAIPLAAAAVMLSIGARQGVDAPFLSGRSRPLLIAGALGATFLMHPLIGVFGLATMLVLILVRPTAAHRATVAGIGGAAVVALPQLAILAGVDAPSWTGAAAWPVGLLMAAWIGGAGPRRGSLSETLPPARSPGIVLLVLLLLGGMSAVALLAAAALSLDPRLPIELLDDGFWAVTHFPLLIAMSLVAVVLLRDLRATVVISVALLTGVGLVVVAGLLPVDNDLGRAIRAELPEAAGYWLPWLLAVAAGIGLGQVWSREAWPTLARVGVAAAAVFFAAFPLRPVASLAVPDREHTYTESSAVALGVGERGYWLGYPDQRRLTAADGNALVASVRAEQSAGRLTQTTRVLHITPSYHAWLATPIGVFTGAMETDLSADAQADIPAAGSRIFDVSRARGFLGADYPYLVIEGYGTSAGFDGMATLAGYRPIGNGDDWRLFRRSED